jgi:uncharacterized protein DUF4062
MLPFTYFSLSAWILWVFQYVILAAAPLTSIQRDLSRTAGLWLGVMQNVFWLTAILSLYLKLSSRVSLILLVLGMLSIVFALPVVYLPWLLTIAPFQILDAVTTASIFLALAASIWRQLRVSKIYAGIFFLHGYCQWIWKYLWLTQSPGARLVLLALFPFWHFLLLCSWYKLITEILGRFRVMISSTIKDLDEERRAADRALAGLNLDGWRSETILRPRYAPKVLCERWAKQCNLFILIIGERYGHIIKSTGKSVVEFEYDVAYRADREKILVYLKEHVKREPQLEEFVERLKDFERGHVIGSFDTHEGLSEKIQNDVAEWLDERRQLMDGGADLG